ncbi:MAG: cupredoxin domain-containing protein [Candidatus Limnocylindrales bacterium]
MTRIAVLFMAALVMFGLAGCAQFTARTSGNGWAEVVMTEMRFSPNRIDAKVGQPITIVIVNRGAQRHDLAFPSIEMPSLRGVETLTLPGQSTTLTMTFDHPGAYEFLCTIPGHAEAGMTGAVFVTP